jgi:hypothetical protein
MRREYAPPGSAMKKADVSVGPFLFFFFDDDL